VTDPASPAPAASAPDTVLIVEPEVLARMMIAGYLRECGYKVIEAANGDEAKLVLAETVRVDVLLSVVELPGAVDGFTLCNWTRARRPNVEVILVGNETRAAKVAGELCEDGPMVKKPYDHKLLADRIKRLLAGRRKTSF
jgi:DNA-binding response OmpR family regulator